MDEAEFDLFADEYLQLHAQNLRLSGEAPEFFAEYKIADVAQLLAGRFPGGNPGILDFGAGIGTSVPYFRHYFPHAKLTCLDVSHKSLELGIARFAEQAEFVHFDGVNVPFPDNRFDVAFLACVLHHIPHTEHLRILLELKRILRPGGTLFVFEHNPYNPLTVHAVNTCPFDENAVLLRPQRLRGIVKHAGFSSANVLYRLFFPHALKALRRLEARMSWIPFGAQYVVYASKP